MNDFTKRIFQLAFILPLLVLSLNSANAQFDCASAQALVIDMTCVDENTGAPNSGDPTGNDLEDNNVCSANYSNGDDYIFSYSPTSKTKLQLDLFATNTWTGLMVTEGCPSTGTCIASSTSSAADESLLTPDLCIGTTYYIHISTWPTPQSAGQFCLNAALVAPDPGFNCDCDPTTTLPCDDGIACTSNDVRTVVTADTTIVCEPCAGTPDPPNFTPTCGETVDYPCGPGTYPNSDSQTWTFDPGPGMYARITFTYVDIETSTGGDLCFDEIVISDLDASTGAICGEPDGDGGVGTGLMAGDCFYSGVPGEALTITFTSDGSVQETGFVFICECSETPPTTCQTALPIDLISFEGKIEKSSNMLMWRTASEINTEWHIIERSKDGVRGWEEVDRISAAGFSNVEQNYMIEDSRPMAQSYYRLRSIDFDGYISTSEVIFLERKSNRFDIVAAYPIPTANMLTVEFETLVDQNIELRLTDMMGATISTFNVPASSGLNSQTIDMADLSSGVYFVTINNGTDRITKRVTKI